MTLQDGTDRSYPKVGKDYYHWTLLNNPEERRSLHNRYQPRKLHIFTFYLNLWRRWLVEKATHAQLVKKFSASLNSKYSVFSSQVSATSPYVEGNKSPLNPRIQQYLLILSFYLHPSPPKGFCLQEFWKAFQQYFSHQRSNKKSNQFHKDVLSSSSCQTLDTFNNIPWLPVISPVDYLHSISRKTYSSLRIIYSHLHYLYPSSMKYHPESGAIKANIKIKITIHTPALLTP